MTHRALFLVLIVAFSCGTFYGCGNEEKVSRPAPVPKKTVKAPVEKKDILPEPDIQKEPVYVYDPTGRRDPFEAIGQVSLPVRHVEAQPLTPLQKFDLDQFKLIGIIMGKGDSVAMVVAPDKKSYVLKKGVKIGRNEGVVVDVVKDAVLIKESYVDMTGNEQNTIQKIQLPEQEGAL